MSAGARRAVAALALAGLPLLERTLLSPGEPAVRARALQALVATGAPRDRLRPVLDRAAAEASSPPELRQAIRAYLAMR